MSITVRIVTVITNLSFGDVVGIVTAQFEADVFVNNFEIEKKRLSHVMQYFLVINECAEMMTFDNKSMELFAKKEIQRQLDNGDHDEEIRKEISQWDK